MTTDRRDELHRPLRDAFAQDIATVSRTPASLLLPVATVALALATAGTCGCSLPGFSPRATAPTTPPSEEWLSEARSKPNVKESAPPRESEDASPKAAGKQGVTVRGQSPTYYGPPAGSAYSQGAAGTGAYAPAPSYAPVQSYAPAPTYAPNSGYPPSNAYAPAPASHAIYDAPATGSQGFNSSGSGQSSGSGELNWSRPAAFLNEGGPAPTGASGIDPYASAPGAAGPTVLAQNGFVQAPGQTYPPGTTIPPTGFPSPDQTIVGGEPFMPPNFADIDAFVEEARTGRLIIGAGVNSEAGVTGQVIVDERNFDIWAFPTSFNDFVEGRAFRGRGQGFRLEAIPGTNVQRYMVSLSDPYLFETLVTSNLSAFYFTRNYFDYDEERVGGRLSLGYRLTQDLSVSVGSRIENITIDNPRVAGVQELDEVIGSNDLYSAQASVTYDTRDIPFFPTEGQFLELSFEQVYGDFEYPRFEADYRRYFLLHERADGSGRHTVAAGARFGITGEDTPLYDHYFAGGFSTLRGFDFRGASPVNNTVTVGGEMRVLTSVEYFFPLTADDMIKGVVFVDAGTVEEKPGIDWDEVRVAPGFGFRLNVPALGAAPLAFDFAFPIAKAEYDDTQIFSFYIGIGKL